MEQQLQQPQMNTDENRQELLVRLARLSGLAKN